MYYFLAAFATILLALLFYVARLGNRQHALLQRTGRSIAAGDRCLQDQ
jgi:hypothetical protein